MRAVLNYCSQVPYQRRLAGSILVGGAPGLVGQGPKVVHHVMLLSQYQLSVWGSTFGVPGSHGSLPAYAMRGRVPRTGISAAPLPMC